MKKMTLVAKWLCFLVIAFIPSLIFAGSPVFTITPLTPTRLQMDKGTTAIVQYIVQNQSSKTFTIAMKPITGVTQLTTGGSCGNPFVLSSKQSCKLSLQINSSQISNHIDGGPVICQQGTNGKPNPLFCYQPSLANVLNITIAPQYIITPSAGANGSISPSTPQTVNSGSSFSFTATPNANYATYQWFVDNVLAQTGGSVFSLNDITANHTVNVTFINAGLFYSGTQNGNVYYSLDAGATWTATTVPSSGNAVNSVFAKSPNLYAGIADGYVYYSMNNGTTWIHNSSLDGSAVNSIFVTDTAIYAGTANGSVGYSIDLGNSWNIVSQPDGSSVDSVFVTSSALYAGTANGNVYYSTNNGATWTAINGLVDGSAIRSIYISNNTLYVGTANEHIYTSTSLQGGGVWVLNAQTAYSLFVNPLDNTLYAGTQSGFVVSITDGVQLGFVTYSPINSIYVLN